MCDGNKVKQLKEELTKLQSVLHQKNLALDAMHWVWCSGGCEGGTHRFTTNDLTEEIVAKAELNTKRLRSWFVNSNFRKEWARMTVEQKNKWMEERRNT